MIDYFALALIHGLLAIMIIRLSLRPDLDHDPWAETDQRARPRGRDDGDA